MKPRNARTIAMWTVAVGVVVVVVTGIALKDRIREEYYLYKLEHGDDDEKVRALEWLGDHASEAAWVHMVDLHCEAFPEFLGLALIRDVYAQPQLVTSAAAALESRARVCTAWVRAFERSLELSGAQYWAKLLAQILRTPSSSSPRSRLFAASTIVAALDRRMPFGSNRELTIHLLLETLSTGDARRRVADAMAPSYRQELPEDVVGALVTACDDQDDRVRRAAADALAKIQGSEPGAK
jgi:HEAT repeat protein